MNPLQQFVAELLEQQGAVVEAIQPEGLEVLAPAHVQQALQAPELARLGFGAELPAGARRVSLESDWMERLAGLLGERGRWLEWRVAVDNPAPGGPERMLQHSLELLNATYRLQDVKPAWTRYLLLRFRYAATSDEKRDGIIELGLNLANGATLDEGLDELAAGALAATPLTTLPAGVDLPAVWAPRRLQSLLERALASRVERQLEPFLNGMRRRQERDLKRLHDYHNDLRREALARLAALPGDQLNEKQALERQRQQARLTAIAREYDAKVNDLRQKYAMNVTVEWVQTLELIMPVQRFATLIKRRKGERLFTLDWNPLIRRLEQAPCEYSHTWERPREVCDQALHLLSPAANGPCAQCGRAYCRVCHAGTCPKCGQNS